MKKVFLITLLFLFTVVAYALPLQYEYGQLQSGQHQLLIDQKSNEIAKNQLLQLKKNQQQTLQYYKDSGVSDSTIKHAEIDVVSAKTSLDGISMALHAAKENRLRLKNRREDLQKAKTRLELLVQEEQKSHESLEKVMGELSFAGEMLSINKQRIDVLELTKSILEARLSYAMNWHRGLLKLQKSQLSKKALKEVNAKMISLQSSLDHWITILTNLHEQLAALTKNEATSETDIQHLKLKIIEANENVELSRLEVYLLSITNSINTISDSVNKPLTASHLNHMEQLAARTRSQLDAAIEFVNSKVSLLELKKHEYQRSLKDNDVSRFMMILNKLQQQYASQSSRVKDLSHQLNGVQKEINARLNQQISQRQKLPGFDLSLWVNLARKAMLVPGMITQITKSSAEQVYGYFEDVSDQSRPMLLFSLLIIALSAYVLRFLLKQASKRLSDSRERFTVNIMYCMTVIFRRTLVGWYAVGLLIATSLVSGARLNLFIYLMLVYLSFTVVVNIARLSLLESISDIGGEDVKLYYHLKWAFLLGAILSFIGVLTHQLPVAYEVKALSNRVFMVFVLVIGFFLFKGRGVLPTVLDSKLQVRRRYVFHALRLLNHLIPLAFISNAIIGLFGYVELAWQISKIQGMFLIVLAAYLITRGLVIDLVDYTSELILKYSKNGWVWTEAFLKPIDKILRFMLVVLTAFVLIHLYGLDNNVVFVNYTTKVLNRKLFGLAGNSITPLVLVKFIIFFLALYWASRWSREFSIRWWYKSFRDLGVRNSLSIFTQYVVVIVGVLIGFQLIGMDLSGFTVIAAAFFAGLGFGLRDMANNFFSGILLLMERPFRNGDIVKLGEYEGAVIHLGIRSTTIKTWDHMEVIVPNSDMFSKPFVNWTHQDSTVRSVITLNVSRQDNPHTIQNLVLDVLAEHSGVIESPIPEVLMKEISDSLVQMEVRYFIVVSAQRSRARTRSEVLFAIWDCFAEHGIKPPLSQYNVNLKQLQGA